MAKPRVRAAGGWAAIRYTFKKAREAGGFFKLLRRLRLKNACKTCALGMGGRRGGMRNEAGHFPEVCKKSIQAQVDDMTGVITEDFLARTPLAQLATLSSREFVKLGRLAFPIVAEPDDPHYRRIGWDEALDRTTRAFGQASPEETFFYASGRASNEAAFLLQLVARAYGTANIHNCSVYCHAASATALNQVYGSGTASVVLDDLALADFALVAGANPASNHPRLITQLVNLRRRGGKVLIVNPLKELGLVRFRVPSQVRSLLFGSRVSDEYLQPRVGTDIALFKALLKGVIERGAVDAEFVGACTTGWPAVEHDLAQASWDELTAACGVDRAAIDRAVELIAGARRGIVFWAMGLTHHTFGVDNILALTNLALARGWLGKPGSGMLPIRGHSNVQGVGSVGVAPAVKAAFAAKLEELYGITIPATPGQDTYASMLAADRGDIRAALLLGGNLYGSNPDLTWAGRALGNIDLTTAITTKLNLGHVVARGRTSIVLPALARDEEAQPTTQESMFNFVRLSAGGTPNVAGLMRSEVEIVASLAERLLPAGRVDWGRFRDHATLRAAIAAVVPGYAPIAQIDAKGDEFQIPGRTFHAPKFSTPDGRAHFAVTSLPDVALAPGEFWLMTLRSEGQFNTVVYEEDDLYRGNTRRDVVMMAGADAARLGVGEGDRVRVTSEAGGLTVSVAIVEIAPGSLAMYYPEANVLVPRRLDERSRTPAFKSVVAKVVPLSASSAPPATAAASPAAAH